MLLVGVVECEGVLRLLLIYRREISFNTKFYKDWELALGVADSRMVAASLVVEGHHHSYTEGVVVVTAACKQCWEVAVACIARQVVEGVVVRQLGERETLMTESQATPID